MAYKAVTQSQSELVEINKQLSDLFFAEFKKTYNSDFPHYERSPYYFKFPEADLHAKVMRFGITTDSRVRSVFDWIAIGEIVSPEELSNTVKRLAYIAAGMYRAMVLRAREDYGNDCGVSDWNGAIKFSHLAWEPSVADPAGVVGSTVAFNLKFVACPREYIPKKKITVEALSTFVPWKEDELQVLADQINKFFND